MTTSTVIVLTALLTGCSGGSASAENFCDDWQSLSAYGRYGAPSDAAQRITIFTAENCAA